MKGLDVESDNFVFQCPNHNFASMTLSPRVRFTFKADNFVFQHVFHIFTLDSLFSTIYSHMSTLTLFGVQLTFETRRLCRLTSGSQLNFEVW
jgi:hypothetical protein